MDITADLILVLAVALAILLLLALLAPFVHRR